MDIYYVHSNRVNKYGNTSDILLKGSEMVCLSSLDRSWNALEEKKKVQEKAENTENYLNSQEFHERECI